ncbi:MAG: hypothetical protein ABSB42_20025 [Tepidisphaeraceae bacterium]
MVSSTSPTPQPRGTEDEYTGESASSAATPKMEAEPKRKTPSILTRIFNYEFHVTDLIIQVILPTVIALVIVFATWLRNQLHWQGIVIVVLACLLLVCVVMLRKLWRILQAERVAALKAAAAHAVFAPFVDAVDEATATIDCLDAAGGPTLKNPLVEGYARLARNWLPVIVKKGGVSRSPLGRKSAAAVHQMYLRSMSSTPKLALSDRLVFPASFEVYAECVLSLLEHVQSTPITLPHPVTIWTLLSKPLEHWYNLSEEPGETYNQPWVHSHVWWEKYKSNVQKLAAERQSGSHVPIQLRRLVSRGVPPSLLVYVPNHYPDNRHYLRISEAAATKSQIIGANVSCPKLRNEVDRALMARPTLELPIHLLAECACGVATNSTAVLEQSPHPQWYRVSGHFQSVFHTAFIGTNSMKFLRNEQHGVFGAYVRNQNVLDRWQYTDVFIVDWGKVSGCSEVFGIAYYEDPIAKVAGMVYLSDDEDNDLIQALTEEWNEAVESANPRSG